MALASINERLETIKAEIECLELEIDHMTVSQFRQLRSIGNNLTKMITNVFYDKGQS